MNKILLILVAIVISTSTFVRADCTISGETMISYGPMSVYEFTCVHNSTGVVSAVLSYPINGVVIGAETDPGATAPTDNYDLTILDSLNYDIMGGALVDRDTANTEKVAPILSTLAQGQPTVGSHTIVFANQSVHNAIVKVRLFIYDYRHEVW